MKGDHVRERLPGVDFTTIDGLTTFLQRDTTTDYWTVHPDWHDTVSEQLFELKSTEMPRLFVRLCSFSEGFKRVFEAAWQAAKKPTKSAGLNSDKPAV
jgi:hypothetical protein